jgi:hypothetical protein
MPRNTPAHSHPRAASASARVEARASAREHSNEARASAREHSNNDQAPLRAIRPPRHDASTVPVASLEELAASLLVSPDDVPLEIEDLAPHFLFEATQSSMPSSAAPAGPPLVRGKDAALREDFFEQDEEHEGGRLREFERIWKHIISREMSSTEL